MSVTVEERIDRLSRHCRRGMDRVRANPAQAAAARAWLDRHPSRMPEVDRLWCECLDGSGPLARWFDGGMKVADWPIEVPMHTVLASHPFASLPSWRILPTSPAS